jgi:4'-phosphopantetheinyl transferase
VTERDGAGWGPLTARCADGTVLPGWWRHDGAFVLTMAATPPLPAAHRVPVALEDPAVLATAVPSASWFIRPLRP